MVCSNQETGLGQKGFASFGQFSSSLPFSSRTWCLFSLSSFQFTSPGNSGLARQDILASDPVS
jgi:hypothetical protein